MALKQVLEAFELLSGARVDGAAVAALLRERGVADVCIESVQGETTGAEVANAVAGFVERVT